MSTNAKPLSGAERVRRAEAKKRDEGWQDIPRGLMSPESVSALENLLAGGYATSKIGVIQRALIEAEENF